MAHRPYERWEEIAHSASHAIGAIACAAGLVLLIVTASVHGDAWRIVGGIAFGSSAILLLTTSALYHGATGQRAKLVLQRLDHSAIYLLIAGTYTAFIMSSMRDAWGWGLFGTVWLLAAVGIANEFREQIRRPVVSASLYLGMGWLGIVGTKQFITSLSASQLHWILAGGIMYTLGIPFYVWKSRPFTHVAWHFFVLAGVACHFVAVLSVMRR